MAVLTLEALVRLHQALGAVFQLQWALEQMAGSSSTSSGGGLTLAAGDGSTCGRATQECLGICPWSLEVRLWVRVAPLTLEVVRLILTMYGTISTTTV